MIEIEIKATNKANGNFEARTFVLDDEHDFKEVFDCQVLRDMIDEVNEVSECSRCGVKEHDDLLSHEGYCDSCHGDMRG